MERMWILDALVDNPHNWLVATNVSREPKGVVIGDIFLLTRDKEEAYAKLNELKGRDDMGEVILMPPYDDTPTLGGLTTVWKQ
jgi:hypothetical protein